MDRFIGYVCLVMNISKHYCKSALVQVTCVKLLSFYWNFLIPVFCIDWLSCELSEQNCFNCHYFFLVVMSNFLYLVFVFIILIFFFCYTVTSSQALHRCFPVPQATFEKESSYKFVLPATMYSSFDSAFGLYYLLKHCLWIVNSRLVGR